MGSLLRQPSSIRARPSSVPSLSPTHCRTSEWRYPSSSFGPRALSTISPPSAGSSSAISATCSRVLRGLRRSGHPQASGLPRRRDPEGPRRARTMARARTTLDEEDRGVEEGYATPGHEPDRRRSGPVDPGVAAARLGMQPTIVPSDHGGSVPGTGPPRALRPPSSPCAAAGRQARALPTASRVARCGRAPLRASRRLADPANGRMWDPGGRALRIEALPARPAARDPTSPPRSRSIRPDGSGAAAREGPNRPDPRRRPASGCRSHASPGGPKGAATGADEAAAHPAGSAPTAIRRSIRAERHPAGHGAAAAARVAVTARTVASPAPGPIAAPSGKPRSTPQAWAGGRAGRGARGAYRGASMRRPTSASISVSSTSPVCSARLPSSMRKQWPWTKHHRA